MILCFIAIVRNYELLKDVFGIMNEIELYINLEKMELIQDNVLVLSHVINRYGLRPNPEQIKEIKETKILAKIKDLRGFLNSINYLKKYISNCSELQELLTELLKKGVIFEIDNRRVAAFQTLKDHI